MTDHKEPNPAQLMLEELKNNWAYYSSLDPRTAGKTFEEGVDFESFKAASDYCDELVECPENLNERH